VAQRTAAIPGLVISDVCDGRILVVAVVDRIQTEHYDRALEAFRAALEGRRAVIVDGSRCEYLSSNGLGALVYYSRKVAESGGRMVVVRPPEAVLRRLPTGVIGGAVAACDTLEEAVDVLKREVLD
jgi:anti-anti-sigma factor